MYLGGLLGSIIFEKYITLKYERDRVRIEIWAARERQSRYDAVKISTDGAELHTAAAQQP